MRFQEFLRVVVSFLLPCAQVGSSAWLAAADETPQEVVYTGTAQGSLDFGYAYRNSGYQETHYAGLWNVTVFASSVDAQDSDRPPEVNYSITIETQSTADIMYGYYWDEEYHRQRILTLGTGGFTHPYTCDPDAQIHYCTPGEFRCCMRIALGDPIHTRGDIAYGTGVAIHEFWTDGKDFYFRIGAGPAVNPDPSNLYTYVNPLSLGLRLYTVDPTAVQPGTWGRIKSMYR